MRIIRCLARTVILFVVLLATLRYTCDNGYTAEQFDCLCHYSQIGVLDELLTERFPVVYKSTIRDPLELKFNWAYDQFDIGYSYLADKINENESMRQFVIKCKERLATVIKQIILRGRFLWNQLSNSNELEYRLRNVVELWKTIQNSLMKYFDYGKDYIISMVELFNERNKKKTSSSSLLDDANDYIEVTRVDPDDKVESQRSSTPTILETVTSGYNPSLPVAIPTNISTATTTTTITTESTNVDNIANDIVLNEQDIIQRQFDVWISSIENKVESLMIVFDKTVNETIIDLIGQKETILKPKFQAFMNKTETYFRNITSATNDIDCRMETDPVTGETIYFDKDGTTQLNRYIDRQYIRDIFQDLNQANDQFVDLVHNELKLLMKEVNEMVEQLRKDYVDIYEEWANVMVNEWSKRLVYADIVSTDSNDNKNNDNWRNFLKVKTQIIESRDDLLNHEVILDDVQTFIRRVEYSLEMLIKENGEYTYILSAKANNAFQKREREEVLLKQEEEEEGSKQQA